MVRARNKPDWFRLGLHHPELTQQGRQIHKFRRSQPNFLAYLAYLKSRDQTLCTNGGSIGQAIKRGNVEFRTLRVDDHDGVS